ncbi:Protein CBG15114 [Caenorhabditis briggsae]|uniref:Protein CBG15114 n=1 Tax=Caenorhabditis briggsae TaxID=6238 RepID=A8XLG1_CAEBR|nr:Protein CBG15114 [Caenorhabditis briggsae]CAP33626.2 Protein CBG15114 [Caenorhabditis briggsae]
MPITTERCLEMLRELHQMKLQLDSCSEILKDLNNNTMRSVMLKRNGSVRGRKNLVKNALRKMEEASGKNSGVVVYLTSCGVLRRSFDRCKAVTSLLEAFRVKFEVRDLNINLFHVAELAEKLKLNQDFQKELIFDSLPLIYVDGYFLGNEKTIVELNDSKVLERILEKYKTSSANSKCSECGNRGYVVCRMCHGSRRHHVASEARFGLILRCSFCDENGISRCRKCL